MKKLPLSLVVLLTVLVMLSAFPVKRALLSLDSELANMVAGAMLTSPSAIFAFFRRQEIRLGLRGGSPGTLDLEKLTVQWPLVIVYGTIVTTGIIQVYVGIMGFLVGYFSPPDMLAAALDLLGIVFGTLVLPLIYFLVGVWVGKRCNRYKPMVLIAIILLERLLNILLTYFVIPNSVFVEIYGMNRSQLFQNPVLWMFFGAIIVLGIVFGLLGVWRGYRLRMSGYIEEVFKVLPDATKQDIVALSYEEAQRTLASSPPGTPPEPALSKPR